MSIVFLADPRPHLEVGGVEAGEMSAFITEGDTPEALEGVPTDRHKEGVRLDGESRR